MNKPFAITPVHDLLLRGSQDMPIGLYHLHLATTEQLTRLHYKPGMLKTVSKQLKVLVDNGYVQADCIPTKQFKSPYYYTLATKGMHYLEGIGMDADPNFRASKEISESYLHLRHALELNDVLIAALRIKVIHHSYMLYRFMHERTLKHAPFKAHLDGRQINLIPDAFLDFHVRRSELPDLSLPLILEHDRGTEQQEHFRRRIRAYKAFLSAGAFKQMVGTERITVAFTTFISSKRVAQMREWTKAELATEPQLSSIFIFAELPKPLEPHHLLFERRWYTLADGQPIALLEG
jgi:Replication-relaxation